MKTQSIEEIKQLVKQVNQAAKSLVLNQHREDRYGQEKEYTARSLKGGVQAILNALKELVNAHEKFVQISTLAEREEIKEYLNQIKNYFSQKDYDNVAVVLDKLKVIIRHYAARSSGVEQANKMDKPLNSSESHAELIRASERMSAAFEERHKKASEMQKLNLWWVFFAGVAVVGTIWVGFFSMENTTLTPTRIAIISLGTSAAWFAASQYVRSRNILNDYEYKSALAKSMIAFLDQFNDPDERAYYLQTVLGQIHQDPLRRKHDFNTPASSLVDVIKDKIRGSRNESN